MTLIELKKQIDAMLESGVDSDTSIAVVYDGTLHGVEGVESRSQLADDFLYNDGEWGGSFDEAGSAKGILIRYHSDD